MTLFEQWRSANNTPPLPAYLAKHENPYLQALKLAQTAEDTFRHREKRRVESWYSRHPECKQLLLPLDWRDEQIRSSKETIDIAKRYGHGWFQRVTGRTESERPEHRLEECDTLDNALALATTIGCEWHQREILQAFPLEKDSSGQVVNKRHRRKKAESRQMELELGV